MEHFFAGYKSLHGAHQAKPVKRKRSPSPVPSLRQKRSSYPAHQQQQQQQQQQQLLSPPSSQQQQGTSPPCSQQDISSPASQHQTSPASPVPSQQEQKPSAAPVGSFHFKVKFVGLYYYRKPKPHQFTKDDIVSLTINERNIIEVRVKFDDGSNRMVGVVASEDAGVLRKGSQYQGFERAPLHFICNVNCGGIGPYAHFHICFPGWRPECENCSVIEWPEPVCRQ
ncbi:hypothetical protein BGZ83_010504 [Gryganskiella cystojenkinii]|nr:hypothetical protein BGZ83_010504 [Gryganskiella cystojenkinii]